MTEIIPKPWGYLLAERGRLLALTHPVERTVPEGRWLVHEPHQRVSEYGDRATALRRLAELGGIPVEVAEALLGDGAPAGPVVGAGPAGQ